MMITLFLAVVLAGLAGAFLFLSYKGSNGTKTPAQVKITPPVSIAPTQTTPTESVTNPFTTTSADLGTNPFASPTAVTNPFGTYKNPFGEATISAVPEPVTNPFEK